MSERLDAAINHVAHCMTELDEIAGRIHHCQEHMAATHADLVALKAEPGEEPAPEEPPAEHPPEHPPEPEPTPTPTPVPEPPHQDHGGAGVPLPYGSMVDGKLVPYTDQRLFTEIHTWWEGDPLPAGHIAHVHAELWVPLGQTVSGIVPFDTRVVMHKNPGNLFRYETALFTGGAGTGHTAAKGLDLDGDPDGTVSVVVHTDLDTRKANDGWHELRVKPRVKHSNGEIQLTSAGWPIRTENGNTDGGGRAQMGAIIGRGWYTDEGYQNPIFVGPVADVLPGKTVKGQWTVNLRLQAGSGGRPPTFAQVLVDADFHNNPEDGDGGGKVLQTWQGAYRGPLTVDTTKLTNGPHKLLLRVEARHEHERLVAIQYVPFQVLN